ncbi:uncharacterized protein LOC18010805 [Eutrema salsugineum]|uniref:uncharacterized protein LOC18010805 n=1 Tax=Eutrema salsugineum TaxID=72664 RepID=UPI000CED2604|nr:uncharacterized protein LOC18010805 [Eutrema salsugineum]XP_024005990.1 uncharacterized protein LOC18010805 [Eutrema salsugineum]XP_024005991.1 uncharacterized protein LOC18010805 [Eutrema salsugineum]XP_024005992.1 uncharacterized protein LOC18010805 [Eutrema salsugineum]
MAEEKGIKDEETLGGEISIAEKIFFSLARFPMNNRWFPSSSASALNPSMSTAGGISIPPLKPPDPPDPSSPLTLSQFPPLSPSSNPIFILKKPLQTSPCLETVVVAPASPTALSGVLTTAEKGLPKTVEISPKISIGTVANPKSDLTKPHKITILKPKSSSPLVTNPALTVPKTNSLPNPSSNPVPPSLIEPSSDPAKTFKHSLCTEPSIPLPENSVPVLTDTTTDPPCPAVDTPGNQPSSFPTLAEKIRQNEDRSLKRLSPVTFAESGRPRIIIPDEVFEHGANLHKDFVICYFNGRPPPFNQIQSVLNHMWGKGRKIEIHLNALARNMLVRIPNDFIRAKVLEKGIWYVGDSLFHTAQWASNHSSKSPELVSLPLWVHLKGIPLDLRTQWGLSLISGLVGEPIETDDFTKNLVSLTLARAKVTVDLTKPLPDVVEFERQNGEVVEVMVEFPWLLPTCAHCKELGHVQRNCLQLPVTPPADPVKKQAKTYVPKGSVMGKTRSDVMPDSKSDAPMKRTVTQVPSAVSQAGLPSSKELILVICHCKDSPDQKANYRYSRFVFSNFHPLIRLTRTYACHTFDDIPEPALLPHKVIGFTRNA